jgi:hypothetical protein
VSDFKQGCVALLATVVVASAAAFRLMTPAVPADARPWLALVSGGLLALGLQSFWSLARGYGRGDASRASLLRRAERGEPPPGEGPHIASGRVRALGAPLVAPISGTICVAYVYSMYDTAAGAGGRRRRVPVYWGYASRAFAIESSATRTRVLAVPQLLMGANKLQGDDAVRAARAFHDRTRFEPAAPVLGPLGSVLEMASQAFTADTGEARQDWSRVGDLRDPAELVLEETVLPVGASASAYGHWSAERDALVPQLGASPPAVSVALGPPESLTPARGGVPHSPAAYLVTATLLTSLGAGLVWFAVRVLPTLR